MISPKGATRAVRVTRLRNGELTRTRDAVAVEEPLEIRVSWRSRSAGRTQEPLVVTMRTPGDDFELAAGFLHGEGIVSGTDDLLELRYCRDVGPQEYNVVEARLAPHVAFDSERMRRNFYASSSCGVCGKASLEAVEVAGCAVLPPGPSVAVELLTALPDRLLEGQGAFARTGGLHAAGLFDTKGRCRVVREDVGRHNAVDKVVGRTFLDRALPGTEGVLVVSGRASFEIVQKAVLAGVPVLVAVGAPSSLAVDLARRFGQTLVGFARDGGFNVYAGSERLG